MHGTTRLSELAWLPPEQRLLYAVRQRPLWQLLPPVLLLIVAIPLGAFGLLSKLGMDTTGASVLVAVIAGIIGFIQNRRQERRQTTVAALAALQTTEPLAGADRMVAGLLRAGEDVDPQLSGSQDQALITLLDYYELLARLALAGSIDRRLLISMRGGAIATLWARIERYVHVRSELYGTRLYEGLGTLVSYEGLRE